MIFNTALYSEKTKLDFHVTRDANLCSSLLPDRTILDEFPETERFDVLKRISLDVDTLDNVLDSANIKHVDFVKLDTQGTELDVVKGGSNILKNGVFGLEIEVEFIPMYQDQPLFSDIDRYLRGYEFRLFDLQKYYWRRKCGLGFDKTTKGQVIHANALYLRSDAYYIDLLKTKCESAFERKALIMKAIIIGLLFGYSDYAISLCNKAVDANILPIAESDDICTSIKKSARRLLTLPNFPGRGRLLGVLNRLMAYSYHGWAMIDYSDLGD